MRQQQNPPNQGSPDPGPKPPSLVPPKDPRLVVEEALDAAYAGAATFDEQARERWIEAAFTRFTKRTEDPKLGWLEHQLTEAGIPHLRHGESAHAPILLVAKDRIEDANAILAQPVEYNGATVALDDIPDDDSMFFGFDVSDLDPEEFDLDAIQGKFPPHDWLGELAEEGPDPHRDGWVSKNTGQP